MENEHHHEDEQHKHDASQETTTTTPKTKRPGMNKSKMIAVAVIVLILLFVWVFKGLFVAAKVNGSFVSRYAVVHELEKSSGKQALQAMVTKMLIHDEAKRVGVAVSADEIATEKKRIEGIVTQQGGTLDAALVQRGLTMDDFMDQIVTQKEVEKLIGDKVSVTDTEIDQFIKQNQYTIPADKLVEAKKQISDQIKQQKVTDAGQKLVDGLLAKAKISYYVNY